MVGLLLNWPPTVSPVESPRFRAIAGINVGVDRDVGLQLIAGDDLARDQIGGGVAVAGLDDVGQRQPLARLADRVGIVDLVRGQRARAERDAAGGRERQAEPENCAAAAPGGLKHDDHPRVLPDIRRMTDPPGRDCTPSWTSATAARGHERLQTPETGNMGMARAGKSEKISIKAHLPPGSCSTSFSRPGHAGAGSGGGRNSAISRRISANSVLGTATSTIWKAT